MVLAPENNLTRRQLEEIIERQAQQIEHLQAQLAWIKEQMGIAKKRMYGASSEKSHPGQQAFVFNEAEETASSEPAAEPELETITITRRKKSGQREAELAALPMQ
ncbi:MAG TPA: transposase, partial [Chthonomonadales bacterium]|nr:transposase [Chthonomonadales bacterium]